MRSAALPAAAVPAQPRREPSRVAGSAEAGETKRQAAAGGGKDPGPGTRCPGPGGGEGAFRQLGFFLPRWLPETAL